ncbi:MAG: RsmB/NOP family class I SAM-dependent RNA methyltransferase [Candidatus Bathyarchaeota archaeon]|nr:RsmB/NOP family class I SAM-dependent RNA methyltransferase [Candidatus Bathyarchaeota archaeon]
MSKREFFINRYKQLGWEFADIQPKQAIRINRSNVESEKLLIRLKKSGVQLKQIPFLKKAYWVNKSKVSVGATAEYLLGFYSIQEAASQIPVSTFTKLKEKKVLDACAAPGGKTVQLADLMDNTGQIVALDVNKKRLRALANHLERCHVKNSIVFFLDARQNSFLNLKFDRILIDVPCSGNFTMDKNWFNRRTIRDIKQNAKLQRELLAKCINCLDDHGEIVYSTCSLEPEENELNMDWAIKNLNLKIEKIDCYGEKGVINVFGQKLSNSITRCKRIWPGKTQGFFVCKLRRKW